MRNSRGIEKKALETATLSIGAPVGDPGGGSFTETFERQMKEGSENGASLINFIKLIWTLFFLDPDYFRSRVWGQSGTCVKDQGSHDLASDYGAQRACFKA